jgi:hypothetical protein
MFYVQGKTIASIFDSPDFAALVTLSAQAQRGIFNIFFFFPLYTEGKREGGRAKQSRGKYIYSTVITIAMGFKPIAIRKAA